MRASDGYQVLLIDLDGTIVDYARTEMTALAAIYSEFFSDCAEFPDFVSTFHACNDELWAAYRRHEVSLDRLRLRRFEVLAGYLGVAGDASAPAAAARMAARFEEELGRAALLFPDARPALRALRALARLVLVTDGIAKVQRAKLATARLREFFDHIVISSEVGHRKPDPALVRHALARAGGDPGSALMVGDSRVSDGAAAQAAGIDFCWVDRSARRAAAAHGRRPQGAGHSWARVLRSPEQAAAMSASGSSPVPVRLRVSDLGALACTLARGRAAGHTSRLLPA